MAIGIEKIGIYPCTMALDIGLLCDARGLDAANFQGRLFCDQRSVMGPFDDVVTMAVNAAKPMLDGVNKNDIKLLIVATESAPDQEKPVSSWVHRFLDLSPECRNFEVKHACYGATGATQIALGWLMSQPDPNAKALIINTDHALIGLGKVQEPVLGAAGVAILLSNNPRIATYDYGWNGVWAHELADIFRPAPGFETGDADESLLSYLDGVQMTYDAYCRQVGSPIEFDQFFAANIYHVPFGGLAQRAHFALARRELGLSRLDAEEHWRRKSAPSLTFNRRMGGIYGGATFVALAGAVSRTEDLKGGDRIGIYAYGSGSCAEFYSVTVGAQANEALRETGIEALLDERRMLTMAEYEACERQTDQAICAANYRPQKDLIPGLYESHYAGRGRLVFEGTSEYYREYKWS